MYIQKLTPVANSFIVLTHTSTRKPLYAASTIVHADASHEAMLDDSYNTIPASKNHHIMMQHKRYIDSNVAFAVGGSVDGPGIEEMFAELEEMDKQPKKNVLEVKRKAKKSSVKK